MDTSTSSPVLSTDPKVEAILKYIPKGQSPRLYVDMVKAHVLGTDKQGNERPFEDLVLFLHACKRTGLEPLTKQIYAVYRWDYRSGKEKMSIQVGIDGMRVVAQRTGEYAGQDDAKFTPEDESLGNPTKASVTVYRLVQNHKVSFTGTARWSEYVQKDKDGKPMTMWAKMPYTMLGKCAEALALRKAFPNELSGLYSEDEMAQASNPVPELPKPTAPSAQAPVVAPEAQNAPKLDIAAAREAIKEEVTVGNG